MTRLKRYRSWTLGIVAAMAAIGLGSAIPASATTQDFYGMQLLTETKPNPNYPAQCLDVDLGTVGNARTNVHLWHCRDEFDSEQGYQLFDQISIPNRPHEEFKLLNRRTNKCLTYNVQGGPGSPVWAESCDKNGQGWSANVNPADPHEMLFVAFETSQRCLDVKNPSGPEGAGIDLWYCDWQLYDTWRTVLF
jgi:ricin-type beta-trefoil lectin protein